MTVHKLKESICMELTINRLTWFGKSLGNVEKVAVMNMALPTPSIARSTIHTNMKPQVDGIFITNLHAHNTDELLAISGLLWNQFQLLKQDLHENG